MWFWERCRELCALVFEEAFCGNYALLTVFCIACLALFAGAVAGYCAKQTGVYAALAALAGAVACVAAATQTITFKAAAILAGSYVALGGLTYLVLWLIIALRARLKKRRESRAEIERKLKFTLPEKENTFVRARLHTALKTDESVAENAETEKETQALPLSHAWKLLARLREKRLSAADGLTARELAALLTAYKDKQTLSKGDVLALNDALAGILKLAAKYSA